MRLVGSDRLPGRGVARVVAHLGSRSRRELEPVPVPVPGRGGVVGGRSVRRRATISLAAAAASQGQLNLAAVIIVASVAGEVEGSSAMPSGSASGDSSWSGRVGVRRGGDGLSHGASRPTPNGAGSPSSSPRPSCPARPECGTVILLSGMPWRHSALPSRLDLAPTGSEGSLLVTIHSATCSSWWRTRPGVLVITLSLRHRRRLQATSSA